MMRPNLVCQFKNGRWRLDPAGWRRSTGGVEWLRCDGGIELVSSSFSALGAQFLTWFSSKRRGEHEQAYTTVFNSSRGSSVASGGNGFSKGPPTIQKLQAGAAAPPRPPNCSLLRLVEDQVPQCARVAVVWIVIGGRRVAVL
jgi:hypothetical protein